MFDFDSMAEVILGLFSSKKCRICGENRGRLICGSCIGGLDRVKPPICRVCGRVQSTEEELCSHCQNLVPPFSICRSVFAYYGSLRDMIIEIKFRNNRHLIEPFIRPFTGYLLLNRHLFQCDIVTWVPRSHTNRGLPDIARQLAEHSAETLKITCSQLIAKSRESLPQHSLSGACRWENAKNAFSLLSEDGIGGRSILLIDDIITTGATVTSCGELLRKAGAEKIRVLTLARTPNRENPETDQD